jgi:hypothetical protein
VEAVEAQLGDGFGTVGVQVWHRWEVFRAQLRIGVALLRMVETQLGDSCGTDEEQVWHS